ncbi:MAG: gliding motility-associated ABC transporter substrate-binding protein GldG [Bacteroidales bacterium]|nr:gliding motility-associated ABC transporter substrate-binding protein GldG [Bacteroidales bacterium]
MFALYKKELSTFFSSIMGYLTLVVFLVLTGLMLWVFRSDFNLLDYGFSSIDGLFFIGPFLYLFLIPAITMRMLAEERRNGTMELLLTKPLSEWQIVWAKFLAGITIVLISLLPTLFYYFTVFSLGDPVGNIDTGSVVGSYIGLLFLGGAFVSIGLFASSLTNNQIVAFIVAALLCAFMHLGFEAIFNMGFLGKVGLLIRNLGMASHYSSISRGVIDSRDVLYFLSVITLFLLATRLVLQSRKWGKRSIQRAHLSSFAAAIAIIVLVSLIGRYLFVRVDLTAEKRYTLSKSTKQMLKDVDETVLFRVYLEGNDLPADYQRLQNETREMLNQFRSYNRYVEYEFFNPNDFENDQERMVFYQKLAQKGIQPASVQTQTKDGVMQQVLIPAADVMYKGRETSIQLMQSQQYLSQEQTLNNSVQDLEYVLANAIHNLSMPEKPRVGFLLGHGELERGALYDIQMSLYESYSMENVVLNNDINALTGRNRNSKDSTMSFFNKYDVLVVAKPTKEFTDQELYLIDQYVMYGGRVLWLIDPLNADLDSLAEQSQAVAIRYPLNLDEMLFSYGVRVNADLIMDIRCRPIPMAVGMVGDKPQLKFIPWYYFPELVPVSEHPIVRNLDLIKTDFVSSIDLIDNNITKTVLLQTSEYCRIKNAPTIIDLNEGKEEPDRRLFNRKNLPVAVLLEGNFHSMWRSRLAPSFVELPEMGYRDSSELTRMIVISDGDMIKNRFSYKDNSHYPLGYDYYTQTMYANKQFILNCIDYLAGNEDLMATRARDVKLRKMNVMKVKENRGFYQALNIGGPVLLVLIGGGIYLLIRRKNLKAGKNSLNNKK